MTGSGGSSPTSGSSGGTSGVSGTGGATGSGTGGATGGTGGASGNGGTVLTGGTGGGASGSGGSAMTGGAGGSGGSSGSGGSGGRPPAVCPATCATGTGSLFYFASTYEISAALEGRWRLCSDGADTFVARPRDAIGVEFSPRTIGDQSGEGVMHYLVAGPGGASRGTGSAYEAMYEFTFSDGVASVIAHTTPFYVRYAPCPEQVEFAKMDVTLGRTVIAGMD